MAWNERAKHDDLDLFQEQEADGSDALNDDTFGDASPIGDDWRPSAAQEAFHRELQQARNSPSGLSHEPGLGIGPPPGLAHKPSRQEGAYGAAASRSGRGGPSYEAMRHLGLDTPPSLLGQPPPAGLFDGLLPRGPRPDLGFRAPGGKGWPGAFPQPDLAPRFSTFPRPPMTAAALAALSMAGRAPPPVQPRPRQTIMSVSELEAQMMAEQMPQMPQMPRPPSPLASLISPGLACGITSTRPPGLASRLGPPGPPGPPPGPPPREGGPPPIPSFLDSLLEPEGLPVGLPPSPPARKWISPFTDQHREAVLEGGMSQILGPFLQSEKSQRQHVGLMTSSDKELIVRIQLGQLASIGEMERARESEHREDRPVLEESKEVEGDRSFGAQRASVHHSRASVDVSQSGLPDERDATSATLPVGLLEADDGPSDGSPVSGEVSTLEPLEQPS